MGGCLQTGRGYLIRGLAAEAEGRTGDALSAAYETFSGFAGAESTHAISALSALAAAHASAGNLQAAEEELARASALLADADAGDDRRRKIRLAHLLIRRSAGAAVEEVQEALLLEPDVMSLRTDGLSRYYHDRLVRSGIAGRDFNQVQGRALRYGV